VKIETRLLTTSDDFSDCIELQKRIWGLDDLGATSPITLTALSMNNPAMGVLLGGFVDGELVGFVLVMPALEPYTVYAHMLGVVDDHRDSGLGQRLNREAFEIIQKKGIRRVFWTFEPLESRNTHVYLNKVGAVGIAYKTSCFEVDCDMHRGLPLDRIMAFLDLDNPAIPEHVESIDDALSKYPVATEKDMPEADTVLVQIPGSLDTLKHEHFEDASKARFATRAIFSEYLNKRGYIGQRLVSGDRDGERQSYYVLEKGE
jgi:predicted GNAT superfamily acetyltransferase